MPEKKVTIPVLHQKMRKGEQIVMLTCYDNPFALIEEKAGIDIVLVGDSMGMTVLGMDSTLPVTMDMMIPHVKAVREGAPNAHVIGDMPYMTYQISKEEAIRNAGRYMAECAVDSVKLEGGRDVAHVIEALTKATIPVMGHIGLTPQSIAQLGGFRSQGRNVAGAVQLIEDAKILEEAGAYAVLVEAVPEPICAIMTERAGVPIISLGAGAKAHGQCLILHDILGFFDRFTPKFVKKYANLNETILNALSEYVEDVKTGKYPEDEHKYPIKDEVAEEVRKHFK